MTTVIPKSYILIEINSFTFTIGFHILYHKTYILSRVNTLTRVFQKDLQNPHEK